MKKLILSIILSVSLFFVSCNNNNESTPGTHKHEDGSTHTDRDTVKPVQEEFIVPDSLSKDSAKTHTHKDGKPHSH